MSVRSRALALALPMLFVLQAADAIALWWLLPRSQSLRLLGIMLLLLGLSIIAAVAAERFRPQRNVAAATEATNTLPADFCHQLRTALNSIIGFAELIEGQFLGPIGNPRYRDYARHIRQSGTAILDLVEDGGGPPLDRGLPPQPDLQPASRAPQPRPIASAGGFG